MPPSSLAPRCLACSRDGPNAMIHRVPAPFLLQSHHTRRLLAALPAPETDPSQHLRTSKVSLLYLAHINCLLSHNALPAGNGSSGRRFLGKFSVLFCFWLITCMVLIWLLLFLFRPQPVREEEGKFCQRNWYCYNWCGTHVYLCRSHILQLASLCLCFVSSSQSMALARWLGKTIRSSALSF